jgi:hypothetical protein
VIAGEDNDLARTIDMATLEKQLPQHLERITRDRERFVIEKDEMPVATLAPTEPTGATAEHVGAALGDLRMQGSQPQAEFPGSRA